MGRNPVRIRRSSLLESLEGWKLVYTFIETDERLVDAKKEGECEIAMPLSVEELRSLQQSPSVHIYIPDICKDVITFAVEQGIDHKVFEKPGELIAAMDTFIDEFHSNDQVKNVVVVGLTGNPPQTEGSIMLRPAATIQEINYQNLDLIVVETKFEGELDALLQRSQEHGLPPLVTLTDQDDLSEKIDAFFKIKDEARPQVLLDDESVEARFVSALLRGRGYDVVTHDKGDLYGDLSGLDGAGLTTLTEQLIREEDHILASTIYLLQILADPQQVPGVIREMEEERVKRQISDDFIRFNGDFARMSRELKDVPTPEHVRTTLEENYMHAYINLRAKTPLDYDAIIAEIVDLEFIKTLPVAAFHDVQDYRDELKKRFDTIENLSTEPQVLAAIKQEVAERRKKRIVQYLEGGKVAFPPIIKSPRVDVVSQNPTFNVHVKLPDAEYTTIVKLFDYVGLDAEQKDKIIQKMDHERRATRWYARVGFEDASGTSFLYGKDFGAIIMRCVEEKGLPEVLEDASEEEREALLMRVMELGAKRSAYIPEKLTENINDKRKIKDRRSYYRDRLIDHSRTSFRHTLDLLLDHHPDKKKLKEFLEDLDKNGEGYLDGVYAPVLDIIAEQPDGVTTDLFLHNWRSNDRGDDLSIRGIDYGALRRGRPLQDDIACALGLGRFTDQKKEIAYVKHFYQNYQKYIDEFNQYVEQRKGRNGNDDFRRIIDAELQVAISNATDPEIKAELENIRAPLITTNNTHYLNKFKEARDQKRKERHLRKSRIVYTILDDILVYEENMKRKSYKPQDELEFMKGFYALKIQRAAQLTNILADRFRNVEQTEETLRYLKQASQTMFEGIAQLKKYLKHEYLPTRQKKSEKNKLEKYDKRLTQMQRVWKTVNEGLKELEIDPAKKEEHYWNHWKKMAS